MSRLQAEDEEEDPQAARNAEKREFDCGNVLEPCRQPWGCLEAAAREGATPLAFSETLLPDPQESDCLPSISLAALLALVFALVSLFLFSRLPFHSCLALTSPKACPRNGSLAFPCLFFPNQPELTWHTLQRYVYRQQQEGNHPDRAWALAAVGPGDSKVTLLCLAKATLSLLTEKHHVRVHFPEQRNAWLPWTAFLENGTIGDSSANIYVGQSFVPSGVIVSLQNSLGGNWSATELNLALLVNGTEQAREEFLLHAVTPTVVLDILSAVHFAGRTPDSLMIVNRSLPVLLVKSEQYLEGCLTC